MNYDEIKLLIRQKETLESAREHMLGTISDLNKKIKEELFAIFLSEELPKIKFFIDFDPLDGYFKLSSQYRVDYAKFAKLKHNEFNFPGLNGMATLYFSYDSNDRQSLNIRVNGNLPSNFATVIEEFKLNVDASSIYNIRDDYDKFMDSLNSLTQAAEYSACERNR